MKPEQVGTPRQVRRPWPVDDSTPGFITERGRTVHATLECPRRLHALDIARLRGRKVWPVEETTTGDARRRGKGVCQCWDASGVERR